MNLDLMFFGNECNLSCGHCFYKEHSPTIMQGKDITRDVATAKRIIERHKSSLIFIYPVEITTSMKAAELFPIIRQTKALTNGIALGNKMIDRLVESGIKEIKITLFSDYETHRLFVNISPRQHAALLKNIAACREKGIEVIASTVITRSTIPTIPKLVRLCSDSGVRRVEFLRITPVGNARQSFDSELVEKPEMIEAIAMIEKLKQEFPNVYLGYGMCFGPDFSGKTIDEARAKIRKHNAKWSETKYQCPSIGQKYFSVSMQSGKIYGCLFMMEEDDFLIGTMDMETAEIKLSQEHFLDPNVLSEKLRGNCSKESCMYHSVCLGGCRSIAYLFAKRRGESDPLYAGMDMCVTKLKEELEM